MSEPKSNSLLGSSALVAAGTGLSRVTGLVRIMALAYALGTTVLADAYNLANTTPNIIYDLVLGGILAATLVPVVVERNEQGDSEGINALVTVVTIALVAVTVIAMFAAPIFVWLYTLDLPAEEAREQASLALPLMLFFLPQILFYGLTTLWTALLNARRHFAAPAFAPVLNNVVVIALFLALPRVAEGELTLESVREDRFLLLLVGLGTTAGIFAMTMVLWPAMRRSGIHLNWNPDWRNPTVRTVARLSGWTLGYVAVNQISLFVVLALANGTGEGAVSAYTYAWLFFQLPHGLLTVSLMTTFTPELAQQAARGTVREFGERFRVGMRLVLAVMVPVTVALLTLAEPLVSLLLGRGAFGDASVETTTTALIWLVAGLPAFSAFLFTMRGFYAWKDTRTPFVLNAAENAVTIVAALALVGPFGLAGVLGSWSLSYVAMAVIAALALARRTEASIATSLLLPLARQIAAAAVMAAAIVAVNEGVGWARSPLGELLNILAGGAAGLAAYVAVLVLLHSDDREVLRAARSRELAATETALLP